MKLLRENSTVSATIWQTYVEGFAFPDDTSKPQAFKDVIMANVKSERAAENYLRSKTGDCHLSVTRIERVRGKWRAPMSEFLKIAELVYEEN